MIQKKFTNNVIVNVLNSVLTRNPAGRERKNVLPSNALLHIYQNSGKGIYISVAIGQIIVNKMQYAFLILK